MPEKDDLVIRSIRKGQLATFESKGSYVRRPAPHDGLLIETTTATILVPLPELRKILTEIDKHPRQALGTEAALSR